MMRRNWPEKTQPQGYQAIFIPGHNNGLPDCNSYLYGYSTIMAHSDDNGLILTTMGFDGAQ